MDNKDKSKATVSFKNGIHVHEGERDVDLSFRHGIHVSSENEKVDVSFSGVHVENENNSVHMDRTEMREYMANETKKHMGKIILSIVMLIIAVGAYIFLGNHYGTHGWSYGWLVFLPVIIINSLIRAIEKRKPTEFAYAVLATLIFLLLGFFKGCWHPAWIVFLTIPVYYIICNKIQNKKQ